MRLRRFIGWLLAALAFLSVAAALGAYAFLKSASFQKLAIRTIVRDATDATGGRMEVGKFDFQLATLTANLYNITLHGTEPAGQPALLHIDKLTVGLKIQSLLRRKITLGELLIEHPIVHIRIDRSGKSNIPPSPQKQGSSSANVFELAAKQVQLADGEISYNDITKPFEADLYGFRTEIRFDPLATRYRGSISYDRGSLRYANDPTFSHSLDAGFSATPTDFSLESALLKVGASTLSVNAELVNYDNPAIQGRYDLHLHTQDLASILRPVTATGDVSLSGGFNYQYGENRPLLHSVSMDGHLASDQLIVSSAEGRLRLHRIQAGYRLENDVFQSSELSFEALGGKASTSIKLEHLDATIVAKVRTTLQDISLQAAQQAVRTATVRRLPTTGRLDGTLTASWTGSLDNLIARADLDLKASSTGESSLSASALPVNGAIHASYDAQQNLITLRETSLRIFSAAVFLQGEVSRYSKLQIQAEAGDLHQLAEMISDLSGRPVSLAISGSASLRAVMQGSLQRPQLTGQFTAQNLQVEGSQWSTAKFGMEANSSLIAVHDAVLVSAHQGKAVLNANVALQRWTYLPISQAAITLSAHNLSVVDLQRLADLHYPVSGNLSAEVSFHGSQLNPSGVGSIRIDNARAYGEAVKHFGATFRADKNSVTSTLDVSLPAGSAEGTISYTPQTTAYALRLNAPAVVLQKLQLVQAKNLGIAGTLSISASGNGTLDNPQLNAAMEIPQLQLKDKSISQLKAQLFVADRRAELTLDSKVAQATLHSHGTINLDGDYYAEAAIDTTAVPLGPLLAMYLPSLPQAFQGETELHVTLKGPLKDKSRITAQLTIPTLKASYQSIEMVAAGPIRADYSNSTVTLQPAEIRGTGTSLRVQGSVPLGGTASPSLTAKGSIDFRVLRMLEPDLQSSGTLALDIRASGTPEDPSIQGHIRLDDVAFSTPSAPLGVQKLNGTLDVNNTGVRFSNLAGEVGGGQVSLGGSVSYRPTLQFNVSAQSKSVRLRYPDGLRALLDGNLVLSGTKDASTLTGRILIDTLSFTPDFDIAKFTDQFSGTAIPAQPGLADTVKLAVEVQSKSNLSATSSQLSVEVQGNLQVVGTAANPVITGRADLTSGELFYRNVRYQLRRGIITFDNPNETEPMLDVSATTTVEQYNLTIAIRGSFDKLSTSYTSDPPLATADIINLIANGQTTQEASANSQSTDSILASQVAGQVTGGIQHLAGISSLQIDPLLGGNNQNPSARVAIQQRVTKNFLFTFSTDLSQPGSEIVQGDYQINKRWSVSLTRDEVGGVSVNGKYHAHF
jgi:translocation and assembly module TamB